MCATVTGTGRPPGIYLDARAPNTTNPFNGQPTAISIQVFGTASSYVSRNSPSYTSLDEMRCNGEFVRNNPWTGWYYLPCANQVSKVSGGFDAAYQSLLPAYNCTTAMSFSFQTSLNEVLNYGWSAQGFGTIGRDPFDWYGGFEVIQQQVAEPNYINVRKIQSTRESDPEKIPSQPAGCAVMASSNMPKLGVPVSDIIKITRISVRL